MKVIDTIEQAIANLSEGHIVAKVTASYRGMSNEYLVAGLLTGMTKDDWWYAFVKRESKEIQGLLRRELFVKLLKGFYIEETQWGRELAEGKYYVLSHLCPVQEFPRYQRKLDCWNEWCSRPGMNDNAF